MVYYRKKWYMHPKGYIANTWKVNMNANESN